MALQVPTVQLESNAPTMLQGGRVTPQQDTATKGVEKFTKAMSQAGKQFAQISESLQEQRDDSIYKEKSMEYQKAVSEAKLEYQSLENKAAIEQVDVDENGEPVTKREQIVKDLSARLEEIAESAENDRQKYLIRTNGEATLLSANNVMTKHEITEGQKYHDANDIAAIDLAADVTGEDYADHGDPLGEFAKNEAKALALVYQYAARKNLPADSPQIKLLIQQTQTKIHTSTLDQMMTKKDFDEAKLYLERNILTGKVSASLYQTYMPKIISGYNKHIGTIYGDLHANSPHNINTGSINDSSIAILKLESSNTFDNGNSVTVANGFNSDEVNTTQLTEEDAKNNFDAIQKELTVEVIPQHKTHQLFLATKLGSKKSDSLFRAGKKELKEAGITEDSEDYNAKLLDKVISLAEKPLFNKYGKRDTKYFDTLVRDMQVLKKQIDYKSDGTTSNRTVDDKTGMFLLADLEKDIKESVTDKDQQEAALTVLRQNYKQESDTRNDVYDAKLNEAMDIVTEKGGTYIDVENFDMFSKEDQQKIKNGHAEISDSKTYIELYNNPTEILPENIGKYRHLLSKTDYRTLANKGQKIAGGGEGAALEASINSDLFKDILAKNGYEDIVYGKQKNKPEKEKQYRSILVAVENRIDYAQKIEGRKLTRDEKAKMVYNAIADTVNVDNRNLFSDPKDKLYSGLMPDKLDDTYVNVQEVVDGKLETKRIYGNEIPTKVMVAIQGSLYERGLPMSQLNIAKEWVKFGRPKTLNEADKNIKATRIYGLMAG